MIRWLLCFGLCALWAAEPLDEYFAYVQQLHQAAGNSTLGEIELVLDPAEIAKVEKVQQARLEKKGMSSSQAAEFARVGVVAQDTFWVWLRDAVYFPGKVPGTYDRLIWKSQLTAQSTGVAVLPILPSGRIVLNLNYRHATRSWELELPRGGSKPSESAEQTARRELKEETGLEVGSMTFLGVIAPDSGALGSLVPVFVGHATSQGLSNREESEAIADVLSFTKEEIRQGLVKGTLSVVLNGQKQEVPLRDSFLTFALLQAELRKDL